MRLEIRDEAASDLEESFDYISRDNLRAAIETLQRLRERINAIVIPELRNIGHAGRAPGTRELVEPPYIIVYELRPKVVTVLAIVHGARER